MNKKFVYQVGNNKKEYIITKFIAVLNGPATVNYYS